MGRSHTRRRTRKTRIICEIVGRGIFARSWVNVTPRKLNRATREVTKAMMPTLQKRLIQERIERDGLDE